MLSTLQRVRLREGHEILVDIGSRSVNAFILDANDPAKLKVKLDNGAVVWVGRKAVENVHESSDD